ncbi:putative bacterial TniB protein [Acinetobacter baumannii 25493_8]|nr:putative bacterial TniB protein [Acinetobacter baumannii 472237-120]EYD33801.1 putative bacterial TniB protein [Acinetobacter baumannii 25493_8]EYD40283.1 putative bacterial TniB protein [Acinetobacter baumannii 25493_5]EYD52192.1 putative bacterial TniB protein [Acinetobacter baumannii 25493_2]EYD56127.1 putative bacterial TniB protein [Acinetobacter baumannii 25493_1]EYS08064.1 putative bacterial TniB protein [Acinetobacter baumannii 25569_7]KCX68802.1 putative bacterial TniB protein [Ac
MTRIAASTSRHQLGRTSPFRRIRILPTRRQTTCPPPNRSTRLRSGSRGRISHHRPVPPAAGGPGLGPSSGGRAHPAPSRRPLDRLSARSRGAEPAGSPLCVAKQATHAQPAAGWPDQQWQVDDRREVPPHPPGQLRRRPGAHPGVGRADAVRAVRDPLLRRAARRDGRAAAPTPTVAGNGATGSGTAAQGRRAHAGDRRAAQRAGRQQRQPPGIPQPAALPRQRTAHPVGWGRHARRLPSHPLR